MKGVSTRTLAIVCGTQVGMLIILAIAIAFQL